jgi:hypothetical protein
MTFSRSASAGTVIDIGAYKLKFVRFSSGRFVEPTRECPHLNVSCDDEGSILECNDCGRQIDAYWWMKEVFKAYESARIELERRFADIEKRESHTFHLQAAVKVEKAWRSRTVVPTCPHCHEAIFPTDGFGGKVLNRKLALACRTKRKNGTACGKRSSTK